MLASLASNGRFASLHPIPRQQRSYFQFPYWLTSPSQSITLAKVCILPPIANCELLNTILNSILGREMRGIEPNSPYRNQTCWERLSIILRSFAIIAADRICRALDAFGGSHWHLGSQNLTESLIGTFKGFLDFSGSWKTQNGNVAETMSAPDSGARIWV
jgi:hypothetical protein